MTAAVNLETRQPSEPTPWDGLWLPAPDCWYTDAPPARRWLFRDSRREQSPGVFPLGKCGQLVAAGGIGKTMAEVALARAVTRGGRWFETFACPEPGPVLLLLGEEDAEEAHRRLYNLTRSEGAPPSGSIVVVPLAGVTCAMLETDANGNPMETGFVSWLRERIASREDWRLIVIDPMSRFAGLDAEKDNALGTRFVQICESFATPTRAVLVSHHTPQVARGKSALEEPRGRGVTSLFDGFRWQAALTSESLDLDDPDEQERLGELVTLSFTKSNYSRKPKPLLLRRDDHGALVRVDDEDLERVTAARAGASARAKQGAQRDAEAAARRGREDDALRSILANGEALSERAIISRLRLVLGRCSDGAARDVVERAIGRGDVVVVPGARRSKLHQWRPSC